MTPTLKDPSKIQSLAYNDSPEEKAEENQEQCEEFEEITGKICQKMKEQEKLNREESSSDKMDITFEEHMDRFKKEHREEMEQLRRPRREKQRIANEELQELRRMYERLALQFRMQSRQRSIEIEEKKEDMLKKLREHLESTIGAYSDFQKEINNTDELSRSCADSKGEMLAKKFANAQNMLFNAFNNLKTLTDDYDDRMSIKIIMKSLSDQASVCNAVGKELVWVVEEKSKDIRKLDELVSRLDSQGIPTTGWLTKESVHVKGKDYAKIKDVPLPEWFRYFM
ncbi:unnamed protein product [Caenorhabditis brenneri]